MMEFVTAVEEAEKDLENEDYVEFKIDDRVIRSFTPTAGQLSVLMASMGRGQSDDQRFANIINIVLETLRPADKDYLEARLMSRDPKVRLPLSTLEGIFKHLTGEWFGRPTESPSGSTGS